MKPHEYLGVLQRSKFCLAPSGMGFSTRSYESIAQGCVPLVIQDDPLTNTSVDQAFDELLPWRQFSVRLRQRDIPHLPELLASFPDGEWRRLKRNLGCVWSRVLGFTLTTRRRASSSPPPPPATPTPPARSPPAAAARPRRLPRAPPPRAPRRAALRPAAAALRLARAGDELRQGPAGRRDARRRRRRAPRVAPPPRVAGRRPDCGVGIRYVGFDYLLEPPLRLRRGDLDPVSASRMFAAYQSSTAPPTSRRASAFRASSHGLSAASWSRSSKATTRRAAASCPCRSPRRSAPPSSRRRRRRRRGRAAPPPPAARSRR